LNNALPLEIIDSMRCCSQAICSDSI
jgi:hypothetical protein